MFAKDDIKRPVLKLPSGVRQPRSLHDVAHLKVTQLGRQNGA